MPLKDFTIAPSRLALVIMVVMLPVSLATVAYLTGQVDDHVQVDEQKLVRYGVSSWVSDAETKVVGQADWDDAMQNLGKAFNPDWAHVFIGQFLCEVAGMARAYVVDGRDHPRYAAAGGLDLPPSDFARVAVASAPLIENVRAQERALHLRPDFGKSLARPLHQSSLRVVDGSPYLITATLVQADYDHVTLPGPAPVVVTLSAMDAGFIQRFSDHFLLENVRIAVGSVEMQAPARASVALRTADGQVVGSISWKPHQPGRELFQMLMLPILALFGGLIAVAYLLDVRERRAQQALILGERRAKHLAFHDSLTGLPNRAMFNEMVARSLADLRASGRSFGLLEIDLDRFKEVNDRYGHGAGDELIVAVAARLVGLAMAGETVARLGGDEFAVVYPNADAALLAAKAQELIRRLALPIELAVGQLFTSASIGGTLIANPQADAGEALRQADVALYCAKAQGRGLYREFDPRMDFERQTRSEIEADLRTALALRRLDLAYQPQVDRAGRVDGVEALIRWNHPSRGFVSPSDFVPIAEECGLIAALGEFVMERAFADARRWPNVTMAVNVSAIQLRTPGFCDAVLGILRRTGANPRRIELEITESILLDKDECTQEVFRKLRAIGFSIAVDDFGIGFSSLSILHSLPLDKIKIDRSFVTSLGLEPEPEKIVIAILGIAAALDLKVVAEGVETPQQLQVLTRAGCRHFQGFLFHRPVAAEGIDQILSGDATLVLTA